MTGVPVRQRAWRRSAPALLLPLLLALGLALGIVGGSATATSSTPGSAPGSAAAENPAGSSAQGHPAPLAPGLRDLPAALPGQPLVEPGRDLRSSSVTAADSARADRTRQPGGSWSALAADSAHPVLDVVVPHPGRAPPVFLDPS